MKYSRLSIAFSSIGIIGVGLHFLNTFTQGYFLFGFIVALVVGAILSFIAIGVKEKGSMKFFSVASLFILLLWVTWYEPFELIRMLTWLKN
ncbi:hypothetical protein ACQKL5_07290 [Peribacillus sp. NPDC097675]|uniref:hypothetical protein n=1 Tax=Peribacillus sp. NPDC097675 TaxID=3390618 RepID=UPI003D07688B